MVMGVGLLFLDGEIMVQKSMMSPHLGLTLTISTIISDTLTNTNLTTYESDGPITIMETIIHNNQSIPGILPYQIMWAFINNER